MTGEDCGEFHLHGGIAVVRSVLTMLATLRGFRPAEAGEFTQRSFLNGKIDLTGAEALSDLIASETERQRELAGRSSSQQRLLYDGWRQRILGLRAQLESVLDFSDQEDVPDQDLSASGNAAREIASEIERHAALYRQAEIVRSGFSVAIVGAPNAGKSSLLNALAMNDVAIVSDEAGTTRDAISVSLDISGYKVIVTDTAGLREGGCSIEKIGMDRAREIARRADLVLRVIDPLAPSFVEVVSDAEILDVWTKADVVDRKADKLSVSSRSGAGLEELIGLIASRIGEVTDGGAEVLPTRERHVRHLLAASGALRLSARADLAEIAADDLRLASMELGRIVGMTDTEEVLGEIFSRFCIGK